MKLENKNAIKETIVRLVEQSVELALSYDDAYGKEGQIDKIADLQKRIDVLARVLEDNTKWHRPPEAND